MENGKPYRQLEAEVEALRLRLEEAEGTLRAIRHHEIDALVIDGPEGQQVFTLQGAEWPYRTLMETMSEVALTVATDGTVLYCNGRLSELTGTPLKILGASVHAFVIARNGQSLEAMLRVCGMKGSRGEFFLKTADGGEVPVSLSARSLMLNDVDACCIVATDLTDQTAAREALEEARAHLEERVAERTTQLSQVNDVLREEITERKQAEEALRESEERLRLLVEGAQDYALFMIDEKGYVVNWNPGAERVKGWTSQEILGRHFSCFYPQELIEQGWPQRELEVAASTGQYHEEAQRLRKDGSIFWADVTTTALRDSHGHLRGFAKLTRDITERKQAEEALQRAEEELRGERDRVRDYMNIAGVLLMVLDREGRVTLMNRRGYGILGYEEGELLGKDWIATCLPGRIRDGITHVFGKLINGDIATSEYNENPVLTKQGEERIVAWHNTIVRDKTGNITGSLSSGEDITERRRTEEALRKAHDELELRVRERTAELQQAYEKLMNETQEREQLEARLRQAQKMEALGTLAGGIAHNFNNMLAAIIGFSEIAAERIPVESGVHRQIKRILEAGMRGRDLVKQMLTFSRRTEQEKKPLLVSSIVKESVKLLRASIPTTISINVDVKSESGLVLGDPVQIQQILMNLSTNAAYAMREKGGTLDIQLSDHSVSPSDDGPHGVKPGPYVKVIVRDTGTGISPEVLDKIFDPFFTTKQVGEGTGLGLSVVHGIVKQHDAHITVESELGRGSTFTLYFPKIAGEIETDAVIEEAFPTGSERILFVDDEEALVELSEGMLSELGYEVTSRMNGREALALFRLDPSRFDLVITDQTMPEMTGIELAKEIFAIRAGMPIIMCTGFSYTVDADKAQAAGIRAFAMKPLTKREIAKTIREVLDR